MNGLFFYFIGFTTYWDYKPTISIHFDSPGIFTGDKKLNLSTIAKIHLKSDVIDDSVVNGTREPIFLSFILDKSSGYKIFSEPETIQ